MTTRASKRRSPVHSKILPLQRRWYDRDGIVFLLLATATLLFFAPAFTSEFVSWDDNLNVSKNPWLNPPTIEHLAHFWKGPFLDLYVPITYSAWGALAAIAWTPTPDARGIQLDPWVFHAANIIVHLAAVWFAYALLRRLVKSRWPAAAGALLFAVHPLQVEAVAWVTGLKDVLCGALSLAALWQYVCFAQAHEADDLHPEADSAKTAPRSTTKGPIGYAAGRTPTATNTRRRPWAHYAAAFILFALAILAKPLAVVIPAAAVVLDLWFVRRKWTKAALAIAPMALVAVGWMVLSVKFQSVVSPADGRHLLLRPLIATDALAFYLYKVVLPIWLGFHYDRSPMTVIHAGWLYYTWLLPAALLVVSIVFRKKAPWALPSIALFVIGVGPVLGLVPFSFQRYATVADRYVYLAMLGPALALATALAWSAKREEAGKPPAFPAKLFATIAIILALLGVRSYIQTLTWQNNAALFANGKKVNPNSAPAYDGLAGDLASEKHPGEPTDAIVMRLNRARDLARRSTELAPDSPDGFITLGSIDMKLLDLPGATKAFRKAVDLVPDKAEALDELGGALAQQGKQEEAEGYLLRAIKANPTLAQAHLNLGMLRTQQRRLDEALAETRLAVGLDGSNPQGRINLAMLLYYHGEPQAALAQLKIASQIDASLPQIQTAYQVITHSRH